MVPIKTVDLSKTYKKGLRKKIESLRKLDLEVQKGEVFGYIGANGAGKSTTIKILMGLLKPTSGKAWLCGKPVSDPEARLKVAYLAEHPQYYKYLTPREFLHSLGKLGGLNGNKIARKTAELLELVSLADSARRQMRTFSKGMIQRTGIAAVLMNDPDLVILDEPMSGLDPLGRHLVSTIIRRLQEEGKTVFFSTHIIPDIETLCDRVGILVKGKLKYVGSIEEALYPPGGKFEMTVQFSDSASGSGEFAKRFDLVWKKSALFTMKKRPRESEKVQPLEGYEICSPTFTGTGVSTEHLSQPCWFRIEVSEAMISSTIKEVMESGGKIISLEPKRRSLEELFLDLACKK